MSSPCPDAMGEMGSKKKERGGFHANRITSQRKRHHQRSNPPSLSESMPMMTTPYFTLGLACLVDVESSIRVPYKQVLDKYLKSVNVSIENPI